MPTPSPAPAGPRLSRRAALAAVAATVGGLVTGCTFGTDGQAGRGPAPATPEPSVDPDVSVAAEALANQRQALALLEATGDRHPRLAANLAPVLAAHRAHEAMLARAVPDGVPVRPSPSPTEPASPVTTAQGTSPSPDTPGTSRVPRRRSRALAQVVTAERTLAISTKRHAFRAQSGAFARLLGSMAAASAQYATVLSAREDAS